MPNNFPLTLTFARCCHADELAKWLGMPEAWAAGVVDAVDGNPSVWTADAPTQAERDDYAAGFVIGQGLLAGNAGAAVAA